MKLTLHMDDYVTAMGGVGLIRLQNWASQHLNSVPPYDAVNSPIQQKDDQLLVDISILPQIPEWFFRYLLDQYSISAREAKRLQSIGEMRDHHSNHDNMKEQIDRLKASIQEQTRKLVNYFPNAPELAEMQECLELVKSLPSDVESNDLMEIKNRYLKLLRTPAFEEKLTFNIIRSFLYNQFFGQVSFLQKSMSNYNLQQHIDKMYEDYIEPVLFEHKILELIYGSLPPEEKYRHIIAHLDLSSKSPYTRWGRELKKLKPDDLDRYFQQELKCSFEEQWLATEFLEEKVFVPLGVSSNNAHNFAWDLRHHPTPISSWIRLILFLSPIGLTPFTRLYKDQFETFYSFVYRDGKPFQILKDNEVLKDLEQNESIDRLIPKILSREQFKAKQEAKPNIQILEFYADIDKKKTVMHYYHIPRHVLIYFQNDEINRMHLIRDRSLRDPFLQLVMENIDPIETIWSYLQKAVRGKALARTAMYALQERWKILCLKEGKRMKHNSIIKEMYDEGVKVRNGLGKMSELRQSQTDYASSGGKRAAGVAYRLLNAAKADNKNQFLDTVIRLYLQVGVPVPAFLLQVLEEKRADFPTLAGAFITGLLSADSSENPEKSSLEEETTTSNND